MADIVRVSGTRSSTPNSGGTAITAPSGPILLSSPSTYVTGNLSVAGSLNTLIIQANDNNVDNPQGFEYNAGNIYGSTAQRALGAVYVAGGLGVEKDLNVGGYIYGRISQATTSQQLVITATNIDSTFYLTFADKSGLVGDEAGSFLFTDGNGVLGLAPDSPADAGLAYNPYLGKLTLDRVRVASTDTTYSSTSGALVVAGGVGIAGDLFVNNITPNEDLTYSLGTTSSQWNTGYVENLYTKIISSTAGPIQIDPEAGLTEILGDIRVLGQTPIGTAPVVTNILYVTVDGSDTNDGRAMDSSRACRTVGGAINSPYYQSGTQIRVAPGLYLEDNPLRLKPYTSVVGSDLRTTSLEPINKTQDLFHLDSGCYLAFMQFLNGRSGLLEGPYTSGFNRGAYCTAFPPLTGTDRIDLFHSPYVQNCTNMTGPWLRDGSMFVPNQTVQVPSAVGTGTWVANTTSIVVSVGSGTIERGMSINAGQQNLGFFNARTLMLANKEFLQDQVVRYINAQVLASALGWAGFEYQQEICRRDVGILIENVAYDATFGGNEKSVESGLAYYRGVVSLIAGQESQTIAAINYLNDRIQDIIVNNTTAVVAGGTLSQIKNIVLTGGSIAATSIDSLFNIITNIISNGVGSAPTIYKSTGPDAAFVSAEVLMQTNRAFIQEDTINWINNTTLAFPYSEVQYANNTKILIDSIASDLLYNGDSQSTFAGLQYWNQSSYVGPIAIGTTIKAIRYLKATANKIIQNIIPGPAGDFIDRFSDGSQITALNFGTDAEVDLISELFDTIIEIINDKSKGRADRIIANGSVSDLDSVKNSYQLLIDNSTYLTNEISAYVATIDSGANISAWASDIDKLISAVAFDLLHGGNRQSIQTALYYYSFDNVSSIPNQTSQTIAAFNYLSSVVTKVVQNIIIEPLQNTVTQKTSNNYASIAEANALSSKVAVITNIINTGPTSSRPVISPIPSTSVAVWTAYQNLLNNRDFLVSEVIAFLDQTYNAASFNYDEAKCYRDVGLIIDAVSQDILLGGNQKSIEAGLAYWSAGYNYVAGQESTTTNAILHAMDIALKVIANEAATEQPNTKLPQIFLPFFQYGGDFMPQQAVMRNFYIITDIITRGPLYAPPVYAGGGLFALTGVNGADVKLSPKVTSIEDRGGNLYRIGLSAPTVGFGNNATLYFGETSVYPLQDFEVPDEWARRKIDPIGAMGGSLVDGAVISSKSPIQSFVYDAFTQIAQGGRGIHITNDGYAQLVSVFTVFCSTGVQVDNGGIASILNSNNNFGNLCLVAKGRGKRKFTGTVYNPVYKAYPPSPATPADEGFDQYYPEGYWPNAGRVQVFLADTDDRPHISLVMEVVPPESYYKYTAENSKTVEPYINEQGYPGFLNATPSIAKLTAGSIVINDINTDGIAIGNRLYIRDQENREIYATTGTIVTDIGYRSVTLNLALTAGGEDPTNNYDLDQINNNYFTLYFCGNSYYTILSSEVADVPNPYNIVGGVEGENILSTAAGLTVDQVQAHITAINSLKQIVKEAIDTSLDPTAPGSLEFIDQRFNIMTDIIGAADINAAELKVTKKLRTKTGTPPVGAGPAISIITANMDAWATTIADAVVSGITSSSTYNALKCKRDIKIILQRLVYDLETGGRYNSVYVGLSYWSRKGTHHIVQLGETVRRTELFPDGCTVNFYQRSYMSASGYVFEYVGAGINYGALPQVGRVDPVQGKETVQVDGGKVFFTSTDQNGDFRIGPGLVISQATGVLSGRTFTKSLFANMTPFILAIESGGA